MMLSLTQVIVTALMFFFSVLFGVACVHKIHDINKFRKVLADYGVTQPWANDTFAYGLPLFEFALAIALLIPRVSVYALVASVLLLGTYLAALLKVYLSGVSLEDCGCGTSFQQGQALTLWPIFRNTLLIALAALSLLMSTQISVYALNNVTLVVPLALVFLLTYLSADQLQSTRQKLTKLQGLV